MDAKEKPKEKPKEKEKGFGITDERKYSNKSIKIKKHTNTNILKGYSKNKSKNNKNKIDNVINNNNNLSKSSNINKSKKKTQRKNSDLYDINNFVVQNNSNKINEKKEFINIPIPVYRELEDNFYSINLIQEKDNNEYHKIKYFPTNTNLNKYSYSNMNSDRDSDLILDADLDLNSDSLINNDVKKLKIYQIF